MAGLPESERNIPPSLTDRHVIKIPMRPLSLEETTHLIDTRIRVVAEGKNCFTEDATRTVHALSSGVPRQINEICRLACLRAADLDELDDIDASDINAIRQAMGVAASAETIVVSTETKQAETTATPRPLHTPITGARDSPIAKLNDSEYQVLTEVEKQLIIYIFQNPGSSAEEIAKGMHKEPVAVRSYLLWLRGRKESRKKPGIDYGKILEETKDGRTKKYRIGVSLNKVLGEM